MDGEPDQDPYASVESGVENQRVILEGRIASLADGGNPGPHISLRPVGAKSIVVHVDQVNELIAALAHVRDRTIATWEDWPDAAKAELGARAQDSSRNRARVDQDRSLFYDRLAERLGDLAAAMSKKPLTPKETVRLLVDVLNLEESQVFPFVTEVDVLALAGRGSGA